MTNQQIEAINRELHPEAEKRAQAYIRDFATSLLLQAKILAFQRRANVVLSTHVEEAKDLVEGERQQSWLRQLVIILGSAFLGAFLQGFVTELSTEPPNPWVIAAYTAMGFIGIMAVFWGLRR